MPGVLAGPGEGTPGSVQLAQGECPKGVDRGLCQVSCQRCG